MTIVGLRARAPGAARAVVAELHGRRCVIVDVDAAVRRGALTASASETVVAAARTALDERLPLVCFVGSSGADITEGIAALHGWGRAAKAIADCSGIVPILIAVTGPAVSGPALLIGLADHVVMTEEAYAFVSGPSMVAEFTGVTISNDELGGARAHARSSGVATIIVPDRETAEAAVADLLAFLPDNADEEPEPWSLTDPIDRLVPECHSIIPASATA